MLIGILEGLYEKTRSKGLAHSHSLSILFLLFLLFSKKGMEGKKS